MKFYCFIHWALAILLSLWLGGNKTSNKEAEKGTVVTESRDFVKPKSVIRISLCRKVARNPLFYPK